MMPLLGAVVPACDRGLARLVFVMEDEEIPRLAVIIYPRWGALCPSVGRPQGLSCSVPFSLVLRPTAAAAGSRGDSDAEADADANTDIGAGRIDQKGRKGKERNTISLIRYGLCSVPILLIRLAQLHCLLPSPSQKYHQFWVTTNVA